MEKNKKSRKKIYLLVLIVCVFVALGTGTYVVVQRLHLAQNEQIYEAMRVPHSDTKAFHLLAGQIVQDMQMTEELPRCEQLYDFDSLQSQNGDIYAWILIPGTEVDYPVLQNEEDNYYLMRNVDGSEGYPGCIYSNVCNSRDFSDYNVVLYGHNMNNGTMFAGLHDFEEKDFFDANDTVLVYTKDCRLTYRIYAAVSFSDQYIPYYYPVDTQEGQQAFVEALQSEADQNGFIREEVEIQPEDRLITLSTCEKAAPDRRYLVVGYLVETAYYE